MLQHKHIPWAEKKPNIWEFFGAVRLLEQKNKFLILYKIIVQPSKDEPVCRCIPIMHSHSLNIKQAVGYIYNSLFS